MGIFLCGDFECFTIKIFTIYVNGGKVVVVMSVVKVAVIIRKNLSVWWWYCW